jgi:CHASE2 domain-containing sensor protein
MEPTELVMVMAIITAIKLASQFLMPMLVAVLLAMLALKSMPMQLVASMPPVVEPMAIIIMVALAFATHYHLNRQ